MPDEKGKLTPKELSDRWKTSPGMDFRAEIIKQLQNEETGRRVNWENLSVTVKGKEYVWIDFPGVREVYENPVEYNESEFFEEIRPFVKSNRFYGDLRGIVLHREDFYKVLLACTQCNGADLMGSYLKGAVLRFANLEGAILIGANLKSQNLRFAHLESAELSISNLEGAKLISAHLEGAKLIGSHLEEADFSFANIEGADIIEAYLEGSNLSYTKMANADLTDAQFHLKSWWWRTGVSRILLRIIKKKDNSKKFIKFMVWLYKKCEKLKEDVSELKPTNLYGAELKNVKLDSDPVLYRELLDEQYLDKFAEKHKIIYPLWLFTSNCGRWTFLVFIWTFILGIMFGFVFYNFSYPSFFPDWAWLETLLDKIDPVFRYNGDPQKLWWQPFYLSFVTMTTLGLASAEPINDAGFWWHTLQNITGYVLLGYLIAVLGSKFTRRSA